MVPLACRSGHSGVVKCDARPPHALHRPTVGCMYLARGVICSIECLSWLSNTRSGAMSPCNPPLRCHMTCHQQLVHSSEEVVNERIKQSIRSDSRCAARADLCKTPGDHASTLLPCPPCRRTIHPPPPPFPAGLQHAVAERRHNTLAPQSADVDALRCCIDRPLNAGRRRGLKLTAHIPAPGGAGALGPARNGCLLRVVAAQSLSGGREELSAPGTTRSGSRSEGDPQFLEFPVRQDDSTAQRREPPLVRVR